MDNNLPKDPPNQNNNNPTPPAFGSNFNPHTNPVDPNNPYVSQPPQQPIPPIQNSQNAPNNPPSPQPQASIHENIARNRPRDAYGHFLPFEHPTNPNPAPSPIPEDTKQDEPKESSLKQILKFIVKIKWVKVSYYIISFIAVVKLIIDVPAIKNLIEANFPNSSPVFAREVTYQGVLKNSSTGLYTLVLPNQDVYNLRFKPSVSLTNLKKVNEVLVKGNLTWTPFVIANAEIYPLNFIIPEETPVPVYNPPATNSAQTK